MPRPQLEVAIGKLRTTLAEMRNAPIWKQIVERRDEVLGRFQPIFAPAHLRELVEDEFKPFLNANVNHHWSRLHRHGPRICEDMAKLRKSMATLLDESRPIQSRLDEISGAIKGFGRATITAIIHVAHPEKYGVWNGTSEKAMRHLALYPEINGGKKLGARYIKINTVLTQLAAALGIDLWTLDALWWMVLGHDSMPGAARDPQTPPTPPTPTGRKGAARAV
jgi:hypothetical protein